TEQAKSHVMVLCVTRPKLCRSSATRLMHSAVSLEWSPLNRSKGEQDIRYRPQLRVFAGRSVSARARPDKATTGASRCASIALHRDRYLIARASKRRPRRANGQIANALGWLEPKIVPSRTWA